MKNIILSLILATVFSLLSSCIKEKSKFPDIVVETEEVVYEYVSPQNDCHPFWCHGSSVLARDNDVLYMSGIETLPQYKPANNLRWVLWKRDAKGWAIQQADETGRTREPCPIGLFSDGRIVMSDNPTLDTATIEKRSTVNKPLILEFSTADMKGPYKTMLPAWVDTPRFTEHTYRTFSIDGKNNELILFNNSRDESCKEWVFRGRDGKWIPGKIKMILDEDDPIPVFGSKYLGVSYPSVVLNERSVHYFGCAAINVWSRIKNLEDAKKVGLDDIVGRGGGQIAGGRFRRLYYAWTPDVTKRDFSSWIEVDNTQENGENIRSTDMWVDPDGTAHLLWHQNPVNLRLRDQYWPDIKRISAMKYAQIKDGKVILKKSLIEAGDVETAERIDGMDKYSVSWGRFHATPDNRLFMIFYITGTDSEGKERSENRLLEVYKDGSVSESVKIPLQNTMNFFMTATHRGGTLPSNTIDLLGYDSNNRLKVCYAKINLVEK